ncbi:MAG: hypothetical protein ACREL1_00750 [bacterium]
MIKKTFLILLMTKSLQACPFCAGNLGQNSCGFSFGIGVSIFMLLGIVASLVGFIVYQIIQQDKKRKS